MLPNKLEARFYLEGFSKMFLINLTYAAMHSSASIASQLDMIAINLCLSVLSPFYPQNQEPCPPVLVPPIKSNTSQGFFIGEPSARAWFNRSIKPLRM